MALKITEDARERVRKMVLASENDALVVEAAVEKLGLDASDAKALVRSIRRDVEKSASVDPKKALGVAVARLNALYSTSTKCQDSKVALATLKEINKLFALYNRITEREEKSEDVEKTRTRAILESAAGRESAGLDLDDLARIVVDRLVAASREAR